MPGSFANRVDTATIAGQSWRTFFADSSLVQLIDTALLNNLDLRVATQRIEVARAGLTTAGVFWYHRSIWQPRRG